MVRDFPLLENKRSPAAEATMSSFIPRSHHLEAEGLDLCRSSRVSIYTDATAPSDFDRKHATIEGEKSSDGDQTKTLRP